MIEFIKVNLRIYLLPTEVYGRIHDANAEGYRPTIVFNFDQEILVSFDFERKIFNYSHIISETHSLCDVTFYAKNIITLGKYHDVEGVFVKKSYLNKSKLNNRFLIIEGNKIVGFGFILDDSYSNCL
jgi:hypothetical protein